MALPDYNGQYGVALMRQNTSTGEWFHVRWLIQPIDNVVDNPGIGVWRYEIWAIAGNNTGNGGIGRGTIHSPGYACSIAALNTKR